MVGHTSKRCSHTDRPHDGPVLAGGIGGAAGHVRLAHVPGAGATTIGSDGRALKGPLAKRNKAAATGLLEEED